jgi:tetratricopeptide (TPR) repeat protein
MKSMFSPTTIGVCVLLACALRVPAAPAQPAEPQTAEEFKQRAFRWFLVKDYDRAVADFSQVIKLQPDSAGAYVIRSQCYLGKGDLEGAVRDLNDVVRLLPVEKAAFAYAMLATLLSSAPKDEIRDGPRAVILARKVCEFYRWEKPEALETLAMAQAENGDFEGAVKSQNKALGLAPGKYDEASIATAQSRLKLYQAGKPCRETPGSAKSPNHFETGRKWMDSKQYERAIASFSLAIKQDAKDWYAYGNRGLCHYATGDDAGAIRDFGEVVRIAPVKDASRIYDQLAMLLSGGPNEKLRDGKRAVELATQVCQFSQYKSPMHLQTLAMACAEAGDFAAAVKWQTTAMELAKPKASELWMKGARDRLDSFKANKPLRIPGPTKSK